MADEFKDDLVKNIILADAETLLWPFAAAMNVDTEKAGDDENVLISLVNSEPRFAGFTVGDLRRARRYALRRLQHDIDGGKTQYTDAPSLASIITSVDGFARNETVRLAPLTIKDSARTPPEVTIMAPTNFNNLSADKKDEVRAYIRSQLEALGYRVAADPIVTQS